MYLALRRFRHLAALVLGVLLFQGTLLGVGMPCAGTFGAAPGDVGNEVASSHGAHGHHGRGAPDASSTEGRHDSRDQRGPEHAQMHCPAAMTCATAGFAGVVTVLPAAVLLPPAQIAAVNAVRPASVFGAPEPPPPRA